MVEKSTLFPLEKILKKCCEDDAVRLSFPDHQRDYYKDYTKTLDELRDNIYPHINIGLAINSGDAGVYTDHGSDHFDEVVRYAGILLGLEITNVSADDDVIEKIKNSRSNWYLTPYEVFLLLQAIRFHDTGNLYGRENHERKILTVMNKINHVGLGDRAENRIISDIGQAHGGKVSDTDRDTIGKLSHADTHNKGSYRPQFIASVLRLADELCEGRKRAQLPDVVLKPNEIYHEYARSIIQCDLNECTLDIRFAMEKNESTTLYGKDDGTSYLTDEIFRRLDKMELERRYCNQFLPPELQVRRFITTINIWENTDIDDTIEHAEILKEEIEVSESGYPGDSRELMSLYPRLAGEELCKHFNVEVGE